MSIVARYALLWWVMLAMILPTAYGMADELGQTSGDMSVSCTNNPKDYSDASIAACTVRTYNPLLFLDKLAERVIHDVNANKDRLQNDTNYAIRMVQEIIVPYIDRSTMAALTIMHPWRNASQGEKSSFTDLFIKQVVNDYKSAFLSAVVQNNGSTSVDFTPLKSDDYKKASKVRVKSSLSMSGSDGIPVMYKLKVVDGRWRIYDIVVNDISMVRSYRSQFKSVITGCSGHLTCLIEKLKSKFS
jgi:phospholipid transport system substrate-binding protein